MHNDGGANSHIFNKRTYFSQFTNCPVRVKQLTDSWANAIGHGLVIIWFPGTNLLIPLWPCYLVEAAPQNTLSCLALKNYNCLPKVSTEALENLELTTNDGTKYKIQSRQHEINTKKGLFQRRPTMVTDGSGKLRHRL